MRSISDFPARLIVLAGLGVAAAGCGSPTDMPPAEPTAASASVSPTEETTVKPLVFAHPADATALDPAVVTDGESLLVTWHIFDGLTRYQSGSTEIEPALATEWSVSDDGLTWTFKLREGVMFHDGTAFDADAVVWNFNRWFDPEHPAHFANQSFEYWADMFQGFKGETDAEGNPKSVFASAEAVDPGTVKITLNRPNAPLLQTLAMSNFAFSSPAAVEAAGESYGTPDGAPIAAGTGPYQVDSWSPGEKILVSAFGDYWNELPASPEIEFRVIPDGTARFLALSGGEIDGMNQVNPEDIQTAQADTENLQVVLEPANNVGYLGFNQARAPWNNLDCRMAVAHAIDKQAIVDTLYEGDAEPASQMMPPSLWGFNSAITDYPYDPVVAKEFLDKCLAAETMPETVNFYVPPVQRFYFPKPKELGELIQAQLAAIGITTAIQSPDWGSIYLPDVRGGKADIWLLGWGGDNGDPDNYLCKFFCGPSADFNSDGNFDAPEGAKPLPPDAALDTLLREAASETDQAVRQAKYEQANQMIHDLLPAVPLLHRSPPILFRSNVTGYTSSPIQTILTGVSRQ
jgi:peptide/nickel transport system substrate-binding protein